MHIVQDWEPVILRKKAPVAPTPSEPVSKKMISNTNSRNESVNLAKVANETEVFHHTHVSKEDARAIIQGRVAKKLTQEKLAQALNLPVKTIADIERGVAIYNGSVLARIKRYLQITPQKN
jgi:ribosome-binding protein aMBF1 (putative translation factor)